MSETIREGRRTREAKPARRPLVPVTFHLDPGLERELVLLARQRGVSRSVLYRQAIREFLARVGPPATAR